MIIVIQCKDQVGLVAALSAVLAGHGLNIVSIRENVDAAHQTFFARLAVDGVSEASRLQEELLRVLPGGALVRVVSHEGKDKETFEAVLGGILNDYVFDYIVLAKFMRILSPDFVGRYPYRIINIHHSFLPAFVGASPYRQAFERGVKLIGATAHFVTNDLDEGPIIAQQIIPVNHTFTPADMVRAGKEIETSVLAKALQLVFEDRVFIAHNKTIVFE